MNLTELERNVAPNAAEAVESEIASLEAQANPLDIQASEERVKRLAYLKRQRQQIADFVRRRERAKEKLDSCSLALQNMGYDLMRLQSGNQTLQQQVSTVTNIEHTTKHATLGKIAVLPMLMLFCYLGLMAYFRSRGGYRAERLVSDEAVADSPPRPAAART